jgi:DNA transposition AAA+ family ATPase
MGAILAALPDEPDEGDRKKPARAVTPAPIDDELRSLAAEASSAHARINIPLNLDNWKTLPEETQRELRWFHQYILDNNIGWKEAEAAIDYEKSTIYRVLKGIYDGSWPKIIAAIRQYRKQAVTLNLEFKENSISKMIFTALSYARNNNSITVIEGESRLGKTVAGKEWAARNNHGQSVFVTAPVVGGIAALVRAIAKRVGVNQNKGVNDTADAVYRAFDENRILIVDEAHRLLPNDQRVNNPQKIEFLRDLHDQTGCALALLVTARFNAALQKGTYQYEQLVGRVGLAVTLLKPKKPGLPVMIPVADIEPIVKQFIKRPGAVLLDTLEGIANRPGRLGIMVETLKAASRIAAVDKEELDETHVRKAIAMRSQMSGGTES